MMPASIQRSVPMRLLLVLLLSVAGVAEAPAAESPGAITIVLVRHGNYVADDGADPTLGPGLSPLGVAQAKLVGARLAPLPFQALYASPMQRARDTADAIGAERPGARFDVLPDLAECTPPTRRAEVMKDEKPEDLAACQARLDRLFAAYFKPSADGDRNMMMVCHGNVIRYLVTRALGVDTQAWLEMSVGHASITRIRIEPDGRMKVLSVGDVGHLPPNLQTGATGDAQHSLSRAVPPG
jgi:serine/threonine-protein phosphatase PGAM5